MPRYASRVEARSSPDYNARKLAEYRSQGRPIPQWLERAIDVGLEAALESLVAEAAPSPAVDEGAVALEAMRAARRAAAPAPAPRPAPALAAASVAERLAALRATNAARAAANHRAGAALRARDAALRAATYVDSDSDDSWEPPVVARAAAAPRQFAAPLPAHLLESLKAALTAANKKTECPICMEEHAPCDTDYSNCGHAYCKPCLTQLKATSGSGSTYKCAVCRAETAK